ncbi:unnamed protein product [Lupinus luteus]|uniref:Uncharacterized protein n=1 Tax=Lupinus luteus TaxID=3873 RepID=A0AAV1Y3H7_LUPLU
MGNYKALTPDLSCHKAKPRGDWNLKTLMNLLMRQWDHRAFLSALWDAEERSSSNDGDVVRSSCGRHSPNDKNGIGGVPSS